MKMGAGLFWGLILIVIGLSIILKVIFGISIFRVVLGAVFILIGIKILVGRPMFHMRTHENMVMFGERVDTTVPIHNKEYNTMFGNTVYDYRNLSKLDDLHTKVTYNTIFGNTDILLPDSIPVKIKTDAVFSSAIMPNGNHITFGTSRYQSDDVMKDAQLLEIEAHVVFGGLNIKK
ncbi:MAG: hypothetical protein JW801_09435 [Bacteroidales bacterium]|nr:hypothetical protein [Bacteroidales bacterium]